MDNFKKETDLFKKSEIVFNELKKNNLRLVDLSKKLNVSSSYLCHLLRLKKIPDIIIDGYYSKLISSSHLFILSRLNSQDQMVLLYEKILSENFTVQQTEEAVRKELYGINTEGKHLTEEFKKELIEKINSKLPSLKVQIIQTRIKGKLILETKNDLENSSELLKELAEKLSR